MMKSMCRYSSFPLLLAAASLAALGCSEAMDDLPRGAVAGTVTLDGKPLAEGTISFTPSEPSGATPGGGAIKDGAFSVPRAEGLVPGNYTVAIYASDRNAEQTKPSSPGGRRDKNSPTKDLIPPKYNASTELKAEIPKGGKTDLNFPLVTN
jgi:hypothetical protein